MLNNSLIEIEILTLMYTFMFDIVMVLTIELIRYRKIDMRDI